MMRIKLLALVALLLVLQAQAHAEKYVGIRQSMTVDDAYKAIPHNKTRFDPSSAVV